MRLALKLVKRSYLNRKYPFEGKEERNKFQVSSLLFRHNRKHKVLSFKRLMARKPKGNHNVTLSLEKLRRFQGLM